MKWGANGITVEFELVELCELTALAELVELDVLDETEDVLVALEGTEAADVAVVLDADTAFPDLGYEIPIAAPTTITMMTKIASAVVPMAGRSFLRGANPRGA